MCRGSWCTGFHEGNSALWKTCKVSDVPYKTCTCGVVLRVLGFGIRTWRLILWWIIFVYLPFKIYVTSTALSVQPPCSAVFMLLAYEWLSEQYSWACGRILQKSPRACLQPPKNLQHACQHMETLDAILFWQKLIDITSWTLCLSLLSDPIICALFYRLIVQPVDCIPWIFIRLRHSGLIYWWRIQECLNEWVFICWLNDKTCPSLCHVRRISMKK